MKTEVPGTIISDFEALLGYFSDNKVRATGNARLMALEVLPRLNALLVSPPKVQFHRPVLKSFPQVRGIFWLLRGSGLLIIRHIEGKAIFQIDAKKNKIWQDLNLVEKYFYLLGLWWFRCFGELIGEGHNWQDRPAIFDLLNFWNEFSKKSEVNFEQVKDYQEFVYFRGAHTLALHQLFGLVEVEEFPSQVGAGWSVKRIKMTEWGEKVTSVVNRAMAKEVLGRGDIFGVVSNPRLFHLLLGKDFLDWEFIDFPQVPIVETRGTFVFKVRLHRWSARIDISATSSWGELSDLILDAVGFEERMHLYDFDVVDDTGRHHSFVHTEAQKTEDSDEFADEKIGKMPLEKGQEIIYTFDYGAEWKFNLVIEEIKDEQTIQPNIYDEKGVAPEQYGL